MLAGKRCIITGGCGFLGREMAQDFASQGALVAIVDRKNVVDNFKLKNNNNIIKAAIGLDLLSAEESKDLYSKASKALGGKVNILVNVAGGFTMGSTLHDSNTQQQQQFLKDFDFLMNLNVKTLLHATGSCLPHFVADKGGKIVNIGARPALQGAALMGPYSASKAAVVSLTQSISQEVKHLGVNVNAICPSVLDTPANREAMPKANFDDWVKPASLAQVAAFLCSDAARDVHGNAVQVYGNS